MARNHGQGFGPAAAQSCQPTESISTSRRTPLPVPLLQRRRGGRFNALGRVKERHVLVEPTGIGAIAHRPARTSGPRPFHVDGQVVGWCGSQDSQLCSGWNSGNPEPSHPNLRCQTIGQIPRLTCPVMGHGRAKAGHSSRGRTGSFRSVVRIKRIVWKWHIIWHPACVLDTADYMEA
jgi:hypothetical protein